MAVKLDNWKEIKQVDNTKHKENEQARERDRSLDARIRAAFQDYKTHGRKISGGRGDSNVKNIPLREGQKSQTDERAHIKNDSKSNAYVTQDPSQNQVAAPKSPSDGVKLSGHVQTSQPKGEALLPKIPNNLHNNVSQFIVAGKPPAAQLANILKANVPPSPPNKTEGDGKKAQVMTEQPELKQFNLLSKVQAPPSSEPGTGTADATKGRQGREIGKKEEGKKAESQRGAQGKGLVSKAQDPSNENRLEATASGVASGDGEVVWVADKEPLGYTINASSRLDENRDYVRERAEKLRKYVLKFEDVLDRAQRLNDNLEGEFGELFAQVRLNRNAPKNPYGVSGA